jgi:ribosomal protein S18 acetylase RimI-like enzyme
MAPASKTLFQSSRLALRRASVDDLETILDIGLAALPMDPQWDYRFPHRRAYPSDTRKYTMMRYREFLEDPNERWMVMLAEHRNAHDACNEPMAFAVWEVKNIKSQTTVQIAQIEKNLKRGYCDSLRRDMMSSLLVGLRRPPIRQGRRDGDCRRMQAWTDTTSASKKLLFDSQFGTSHFQLQLLATSPQFQRQGAGSQLVRWGMQLAEYLNVAISVFASPMGEQLYLRLGFRRLASVFVHVEKEKESVELAAMVYLPSAGTAPSPRDAPSIAFAPQIKPLLLGLPIRICCTTQVPFQVELAGGAGCGRTRPTVDDVRGAVPA